jgi:hypothetical protein
VRTVRGIRKDLRRVEEALAHIPDGITGEAADLMNLGAVQHRDALTEELDLARRPSLDVVLEGLPVIGHEVRIDALARLLHSLQGSISSVAQATVGKATSRAPIQVSLRESTSLRLASVYPGSFGAVLRGPLQPEAQDDPLFDFEDSVPSLLDESVETVLQIVDLALADSPDDGPIIDAVLPLGSRTFKHLKDLADVIMSERLEAKIRFVAPSSVPHETSLNPRGAARLRDVLGRNRASEETETMQGHLGSASEIRNRIELQTATDLIPAKVVEDLVPELREYFGRDVDATFQVTTVVSLPTGVERRSYLLTGLSMRAEPGVLEEE